MRAYLFEVRTGKGVENTQNRVYIPGKGVFGYTCLDDGVEIDFFSNNNDVVNHARYVIKNKHTGNGGDYLCTLSLPKTLVEKLAKAAKKFDSAESNFKATGRSLSERVAKCLGD